MKPLRLEMQAFESYYDKTVIDFEKLNQEKVFLILGKTGCGKTTIFDALSYALYGKSSGAQRADENNQLKNRDADHTKECYVELVFENNGKRYKVRRSPAQEVMASRKKEGAKKQGNLAELDFLDEPEKPTINSKVNEKIVEILGLDKNQFNQVCMLAQGDFSKILTSDTMERTRILRKIFQTELYDDFSKKVSERFKEVNTKIESIKSNLDETYNRTCYLTDEANERKNEGTSDEYRISFMQKGFADCNEKLNQIKNDKDKSSERIILLNTELNEAKKHRDDIEEENKEKQNILLYKEKDEMISNQLNDLESKKPEIESYHERYVSLQLKLDDYKELTKLNTEIYSIKSLLAKEAEEKQDCEEKLAIAKNVEFNKEARLHQIEEELKNETDTSIELTRLQSKTELIENAFSMLEQLKDINDSIQDAYQNFTLLENEFSKVNKKHEFIEHGYYSSMAGNLATNQLKENMPCPVCGSLSHPHPASLSDDDVTKEEYEKSKKKLESARTSKENAKTLLETLSAQRDEKKLQFNVSLKSLSINIDDGLEFTDFIKESKKSLLENQRACQEELKELKKKQNKYLSLREEKDSVDNDLKKTKANIDTYSTKLNDLIASISSHETMAKEKESQYQSLKKGLEFENENKAKAEVNRLKDCVTSYQSKVTALQKDKQDNLALLSSTNGKLETVQKRIQNFHGREEETINLELDKENANHEMLEDNEKSIVSIRSNLKQALNDYVTKKSDNEKLIEKFNILVKFKRYFNADSKSKTDDKDNKRWVSLETYILSYYLDRILERASDRLQRMSNGNYSLLRRIDDAVTGNGQGGLDIDVKDNISGTIRHAKTLSGGETFMASLSLALGLSDFVKETTSKSHIETLYVDEGFGTLDKETLENVVNVLTDLASKEATTIGLISHVEDLKMYFSKGIEVKKDTVGHSTLKII